jgi:hypothetical protein
MVESEGKIRIINHDGRIITGRTARIKPESFDLAVLPDAGDAGPRWVTRPDGTVERDGPLEGKAVSYSRVFSGPSLWRSLEVGTQKKGNRNKRKEEWVSVHGQ